MVYLPRHTNGIKPDVRVSNQQREDAHRSEVLHSVEDLRLPGFDAEGGWQEPVYELSLEGSRKKRAHFRMQRRHLGARFGMQRALWQAPQAVKKPLHAPAAHRAQKDCRKLCQEEVQNALPRASIGSQCRKEEGYA